jgi:hypothetical protein
MRLRLVRLLMIIPVVSSLLAVRAAAVTQTFTINTASSSLTIDGDVLGATITAQTPGSTATSYSGSILADLTGSNITFVGGSSVNANTLATKQQPDADGLPGSASADYGFAVSIPVIGSGDAAVRSLVLDLTSGPMTISGTTVPGGETIAITSGFVDYTSNITFGRQDISGNSGTNMAGAGSLATNGSTQTLTIPIDVTYNFSLATTDDTTLHASGKLVASRTVPEPTISVMILALGGGAEMLRRRRHSV